MKEKNARFKLEIHNKETQQIKNFLNRTGTGIRQHPLVPYGPQ